MWLNQGPIFSPPHEGTFAETEAVTLTNWASLPAFISVPGRHLSFPSFHWLALLECHCHLLPNFHGTALLTKALTNSL